MYFIWVFPAWEVLWFVCLFPHNRFYLFEFFRHEKFFGLFVCLFPHDRCYLFEFSRMRSSLVCLFVASWPMLSIVSPLHFAWFVSGSRSVICCYLVADVIHCTLLLPCFFAISISLRGLPVFSLSFVLFLITGVLSHCYTFSLKATTLLQFSRHEKFIYSFVPSWPMLFIAFLLLLYTKNFAWYNGFS